MLTRITRTCAEEVLSVFSGMHRSNYGSSRSELPCWMFRGHAEEAWHLRARFHRCLLDPESDPTTTLAWTRTLAGVLDLPLPKPLPLPNRFGVEERTHLSSKAAEGLASDLCSFAQLAGELGLLTGAAASEATNWMNQFDPRGQRASSPPGIALMGLAQHHGIPTPLLDWTRNPFVAAWFAASEVLAEKDCGPAGATDDRFACIWALPTHGVSDHLAVYTLLDQAYARSQGGLFTRDLKAEKQFTFEGSIRCLQDAKWMQTVEERTPSESLAGKLNTGFVVRFPRARARSVVWKLRQIHQITSAHLMPTLTNAARVSRDIRAS